MASANKDVSGYELSIFKNQIKAKEYQCALCHHVCHNAVELSCGDDTNIPSDFEPVTTDDHDVLFCEHCLSDHLRVNEQRCPINDRHQNVSFNAARNIRKQINNLTVCCRLQKHQNPSKPPKSEGPNQSDCEWEGTVSEFKKHQKSCIHCIAMRQNTTFCKICNLEIDENTVNEHDQRHLSLHISILHSKLVQIQTDSNSMDSVSNSLRSNSNSKRDSEQKQISKSLKSLQRHFGEIEKWKKSMNSQRTKSENEFIQRFKSMELQIESLHEEHSKLKELTVSQSLEIQELRSMITALVSMQNSVQNPMQNSVQNSVQNLVSNSMSNPLPKVLRGVSINLKRPLSIDSADTMHANDDEKSSENHQNHQKHQKQQIQQFKPLLLRNDGQRASYGVNLNLEPDVMTDDEAKTTVIFMSDTEPFSEDTLDEHHVTTKTTKRPPCAPLQTTALNLSFRSLTPLSSTPGTMSRQNSTRYFHPEGVELYHPKKVHFEMYHPQRAVKVRVVKPNGGGMKWRSRFMCCGSAKDESVSRKVVSTYILQDDAMIKMITSY